MSSPGVSLCDPRCGHRLHRHPLGSGPPRPLPIRACAAPVLDRGGWGAELLPVHPLSPGALSGLLESFQRL